MGQKICKCCQGNNNEDDSSLTTQKPKAMLDKDYDSSYIIGNDEDMLGYYDFKNWQNLPSEIKEKVAASKIQHTYKKYKERCKYNELKCELCTDEKAFIETKLKEYNINKYQEIDSLNPNFYITLKTEEESTKKNYQSKLLVKLITEIDPNTKKPICQYETIYIGEVNILYQKNGKGTLYTPNRKYDGFWKEDEMVGIGRMTDLVEESTVEGMFINSKVNGNGKKFTKVYTYKGNFVEDIFDGEGEEETDDYVYKGMFKNNVKEGKGKVFYKKSGEKYTGEFKDNNINGYGKYQWSNKHIYEGNFVLGKMHGKGVYTWPDGSIYRGTYKNNIKEGYGEFQKSNGKLFKGNFINGKFDRENGKVFVNGIERGIKTNSLIEVMSK